MWRKFIGVHLFAICALWALGESSYLLVGESTIVVLPPEYASLAREDCGDFLCSVDMVSSLQQASANRRQKQTRNPTEQSEFWEGDILLPPNRDEKYFMEHGVIGVEEDPNLLWPDGVVHYAVDEHFTEREEEEILVAMESYHRLTKCVRFEQWGGEMDYVQFVKSNETGACGSHVGRIGGQQLLILGPDCISVQEILHLLDHTIGFAHEMNSPDRDEYVDIAWKNVHKDAVKFFTKRRASSSSRRWPYDYASIMHSSKHAHGIHPTAITLVPKSSNHGIQIGSHGGFSDTDLKRISDVYRCEELKPVTTTTQATTTELPTTEEPTSTTAPTTILATTEGSTTMEVSTSADDQTTIASTSEALTTLITFGDTTEVPEFASTEQITTLSATVTDTVNPSTMEIDTTEHLSTAEMETTTTTTTITTQGTTQVPQTTLSPMQDLLFESCRNFTGNTGEGSCWQINDPSDCTRFIKCANNIASFQNCPAGLHYDVDKCQCEWPDQARCLLGVTLRWCDGCH